MPPVIVLTSVALLLLSGSSVPFPTAAGLLDAVGRWGEEPPAGTSVYE